MGHAFIAGTGSLYPAPRWSRLLRRRAARIAKDIEHTKIGAEEPIPTGHALI